MNKRIPLAVLAVVASLGLAACGEETFDQGSLDDNVKSTFKEAGAPEPKSVDCPDDAPAKKGSTFECKSVAANGTEVTFKWKATNDDGELDIVNAEEVGMAIGQDQAAG